MISRTDSRRFVLFFLLMFALVVALWIRLFSVQIIDKRNLRERAHRQQSQIRIIPARRGRILDANGEVLAEDKLTESFYLSAMEIEDADAFDSVACGLAKILSVPSDTMTRLMKRYGGYYTLVEDASLETSRAIQELKERIEKRYLYSGIHKQISYKRYYPHGALLSQVIGYTDEKRHGKDGVERQYEDFLAGTDGKVEIFVDALRRPHTVFRRKLSWPISGADVKLTVDIQLQRIVEEELESAYKKWHPEDVRAVVLDPRTGKVLAMATYPTFDPNRIMRKDSTSLRNRVIMDRFEPGSVFKLVCASSVIQYSTFDLTDTVDCGDGVMQIYDCKITDHHKYHRETGYDCFVKSINVGTVNISSSVPKDKFYDMARAYGFGAKTGIDSPGEVSGWLEMPKNWTGVSMSYMAIGYEVDVTALQIANAYSAVANGGILWRPYIVSQIASEDGVIFENSPHAIRRVIDKETADSLRQILTEVVERGTGTKAKIPGIPVAGKTGTAQIAKGKRGYDKISGGYTASFVGMVPADSPEMVAYVVVRHPKGKYFGGTVAAPVVRQIFYRAAASGMIRNCTFADTTNPSEHENTPNFVGLTRFQAEELSKSIELPVVFLGKGDIVLNQNPACGKVDTVFLYLGAGKLDRERLEMPTLEGLTLREAMRAADIFGIPIRVVGSGIVRQQIPKPGILVDRKTPCLLICEVP
ncbi:MAG: hypothetical protein B6D65_02710 [candidate division Zixibacteria bacterium 4484_93]|nr:MAG: hypothetical protein B6D65_02710 [candidate division Zixibacteria bacterium 4484_93]